MGTETKTTAPARYLIRGVDRWDRGRMRTTWRTHHVDCDVPKRAGAWRRTTVAMSDLPGCCAHLDDPQRAN